MKKKRREMRKTVHLCLSSHSEVMYRNEADLVMGFNCLALAILETDSRLLGEGFMTTHNHKLVQTDSPKELSRRDRYAYSRYFNSKYKRSGRLGEREVFSLEVEGALHTMNALNYVLRQGLHHGLSATPFGYAYCSANAFFRKDLGKDILPVLISPKRRNNFLPQHTRLSEDYRIAANGQILREDIIDTSYVEQIYISPKNYLFQMNRISDEKVVREQMEENLLPPVTLDVIETGVSAFDIKAALINEMGRIDRHRLTDLKLCHIIDDVYLPRCMNNGSGVSIYELSDTKRAELGNKIWADAYKMSEYPARQPFFGHRPTKAQLMRCLAL